jgi:hypothetical protein
MDAYDHLYDQDALYRSDLAWQAEIHCHNAGAGLLPA